VDSLAGFLKWQDAPPFDGVPQQSEYTVVPGSLLGKALVAQDVFDHKFLLPFAPSAPEFFLVPGDNQVTVLWRPSASEQTGDPYFAIANSATQTAPGGGTVNNSLYDPNYRQFDVEGYRVFRGRVDAPSSLTLLAQFDYGGTSISDYSGFVYGASSAGANPLTTCAPDQQIVVGCGAAYDTTQFHPGITRTHKYDIPLVGPIIQVKTGGRAELASGDLQILTADTAVTGHASGFPTLSDNGVPFVYVDRTVRNNFRYFYAVTAFDVNSFASGLTSIESARITKAVTPHVAASNTSSAVATEPFIKGRGQSLNFEASAPSLDPATLKFSGPFPASNGWDAGFVSTVSQVLNGSGSFSIRLDSIALGNAVEGLANTYYLTATSSAGTAPITVSLLQDFVEPPVSAAGTPFKAAAVDPGSSKFGGSDDFALYGGIHMTLPGEYLTSQWGRAAAFGSQTDGFPNLATASGPRWFVGDNETMDNPNANYAVTPASLAQFSNAGQLPGISVIHYGMAYLQGYRGVGFRDFNGMFGGAVRAADFKLYWGAGGTVDSVIDVTHNVPVPFDTAFGGSWGFLTPASATSTASVDANTGVVSLADYVCVAPAPQQVAAGLQATDIDCGDAAATKPYKLVQTATIAPLQIGNSAASIKAAPPPGQTGFGLYMPGFPFLMAATQLPAAGTVWTLRSYVGGITEDGTFFEVPRTFSAVGAEIGVSYTASNSIATPTLADLNRVHTVPDPYYITNELEQSTDVKILKFVNLPNVATIRIYSSSGVLVDVIEHNSATSDGTESWNLQNRNHQVVASGVYFYHIEAGDARRVGRFTVVNFAQ
jgi:hypothetical protein